MVEGLKTGVEARTDSKRKRGLERSVSFARLNPPLNAAYRQHPESVSYALGSGFQLAQVGGLLGWNDELGYRLIDAKASAKPSVAYF
ncbi:hypothetical protein [Oceanithermus sp.]